MTLLIQNNNSFIVIGVFLVDAVVKWSNCWTRWVGTDISQGVETYVRDVTSVCPSYSVYGVYGTGIKTSHAGK